MRLVSSRNAHVPPPDPALYWPFHAGQQRTIGYNPFVAFKVLRIHHAHIEGLQTLAEQQITGILLLDQPVVICRIATTGEPAVTLTLRKIDAGRAFLQVTGHPSFAAVPLA